MVRQGCAVEIVLQPKQADLLARLEATGDVPTFLGWGGARGSAKSGGLRRIAIALASSHPNIVIYIVRRVLKDVLENHMEKIALEFPEIDKLYRQTDHEYPFVNGSRIVFVYAETKIDVKRISYGPECTFLFVDQAEQFDEEELMAFRICNRWPAMAKGFAKTCLFFNVGLGIGAGFLRRVFHLRQFRENERPADYHFTQAYGWDNFEWFRSQMEITEKQFYAMPNAARFTMFINDTSEGRKMNALPKHLREGELMGNFDSFSGQYFADVWGEHCVITQSEIDRIVQPWWTRWMAQDWGFGDHDYHCWLVTGKVSPKDWMEVMGGYVEWPMEIAILYRENLVNGRAEADLGNDIADMTPMEERPYIKDFFLSQDAFGQKAKQHGANTVGEQFTAIMKRNKMPVPAPADQDRLNGWRFFYNCLRQAGLRGANIETERAKQGPALFVSVNCPAAIENIPLAVRDEDDPNDIMRVPGAIWEDVTDGIRYGLKSKLAPKGKAPLEVRAREAFDKAKSPTEAALAMRHFHERERQQNRVSRPNWRG